MSFAPEDALSALLTKALIFNPNGGDSLALLPRIMQALPTNLMLLNQPDITVEEIRALSARKREILTLIARAGGSMVTVGAQAKIADSRDFKELLSQGSLLKAASTPSLFPALSGRLCRAISHDYPAAAAGQLA